MPVVVQLDLLLFFDVAQAAVFGGLAGLSSTEYKLQGTQHD